MLLQLGRLPRKHSCNNCKVNKLHRSQINQSRKKILVHKGLRSRSGLKRLFA